MEVQVSELYLNQIRIAAFTLFAKWATWAIAGVVQVSGISLVPPDIEKHTNLHENKV